MEFIDNKLKEYIVQNILPEYNNNEKAHGIEHINYVIRRSFELIKQNNLSVDYNKVYVIAAYHDIGHYIDPKKHEIISAEIMSEDENLKQYFSSEDLTIIKEAIEDHRASSSLIPRNIYGKILSSADRKVSIKNYFVASLFFGHPNINEVEMNEAIDQSYNHAIKKFGKDGYATKKFYVEDNRYKKFLNDLQELIENKDEFYRLAGIVFKEVKEGKYE